MQEYKRPAKTIPRSPGIREEWIEAIKKGTKSTTDFSYSGPLTEVMLLANVAARLKDKNVKLLWDGEKMEFTNLPEANQFLSLRLPPRLVACDANLPMELYRGDQMKRPYALPLFVAAALLTPGARWPAFSGQIHDANRPMAARHHARPGRATRPAALGRRRPVRRQGSLPWSDGKGLPAKLEGRERLHRGRAQAPASIRTVKGFGDCQLHVEWMAPVDRPRARARAGATAASSSWTSTKSRSSTATTTRPMPTARPRPFTASIRRSSTPAGQPGEWQTYDIVFHRPRFDKDGKVLAPARMTVFHNGVLVHENARLTGPTAHKARPPYKMHADKLPVSLQDHGNPVRFRDIWIRNLE